MSNVGQQMIKNLNESGISVVAIAAGTNISYNTLLKIKSGHTKSLTPPIMEKLLGYYLAKTKRNVI